MIRWIYRQIYNVALNLLLPVALLRLWWRGRHAPAYRQRIGERMGWYVPPHPCALWVHAVSVGETVAAVPLIQAVLQNQPHLTVMVTNTTPTGAERVRTLLGATVAQAYLPWDRPAAVKRWIRHLKPQVLVIMETELWPNLLAIAQAEGVWIILANARLSARSAQGYGRWPGLVRPMLHCLHQVAAQDAATAERLQWLGVPAERIAVTGSLKFDAQRPAFDRQQLREQRTPGRFPVVVAGSTHAGEESLILQAFTDFRQHYPQALLILVPRHPERFAEVTQLLQSGGWSMQRRSDAEALRSDTAVWLGDTMGEMLLWYAMADIALVAGSLRQELGGHNMLEPVLLGVPTLSGHYVLNFQTIAEILVQAGALRLVEAGELSSVWQELMQRPALRQAMVQAGEQVLSANRGALQRQVALVLHALARTQRTTALPT